MIKLLSVLLSCVRRFLWLKFFYRKQDLISKSGIKVLEYGLMPQCDKAFMSYTVRKWFEKGVSSMTTDEQERLREITAIYSTEPPIKPVGHAEGCLCEPCKYSRRWHEIRREAKAV